MISYPDGRVFVPWLPIYQNQKKGDEMKLDKAKEILSLECTKCTASTDPDLKDALHLGIEAISMVQRARDFKWNRWPGRLPGETPAAASP